MEKEKIASLQQKIEDVIWNEDVSFGEVFAAIAMVCGNVVETIVKNNVTTREGAVAILLESITVSCQPDEEDNTPQS